MIPSMGQGALGIEAINNPEVVAIAARLEMNLAVLRQRLSVILLSY